MTPHEWLLDQIERDRQWARAWVHDNIDDGGFYSCPATRSEPSGDLRYGEDACECGLKRRRRRELVDCDAKEQIVRHDLEWQATLHETPEGWTAVGCTPYRMAMEWCTLRVAAMYDDRPGWTEHWGHAVVDEPVKEAIVTTWREYLDSSIKVISDLCVEREHAYTRFGKAEPNVCADCTVIINRLRGMYRDDNPTPPTVLVHLVVDEGGLFAATLDEPLAIRKARAIKAVVASLPVSSDWRNTPNEEQE